MTRETIRDLVDRFGLRSITLEELLWEQDSTAPIGRTETAPISHRTLRTAIRCYEARRTRDQHFAGRALFADPAWDILLDLFIREAQGEPVSVKSASVGSNVAPSTALRWLKVLESEGLIISRDDSEDRRCRLVTLTSDGRRIMTDCLAAIAG